MRQGIPKEDASVLKKQGSGHVHCAISMVACWGHGAFAGVEVVGWVGTRRGTFQAERTVHGRGAESIRASCILRSATPLSLILMWRILWKGQSKDSGEDS